MNLDLSKFKKIEDTPKSARLKHPDGHEIHISKKTLSQPMKQQLSKLPIHFEEGGMTSDDMMNQTQQKPAPQPQTQSQPPQQPVQITINSGAQAPMPGPLQQQQAPAPLPGILQHQLDQGRAAQNLIHSDAPLGTKIGQGFGQALRNGIQDASDVIRTPLQMAQSAVAPIGQGFMQGFNPQDPTEPQAAMAPQPGQGPDLKDPQISDQQIDEATKLQKGGKQRADSGFNYNEIPGFGDQMAGAKMEADVQGRLGKAKADLLSNYNDEQEDQLTQAKVDNVDYRGDQARLQNDAEKFHIDADQYVKKMSTGSKIATAIGLIIGGIGQGAAGMKSNPVMDMLQKNIDNDVLGQREEMGKKMNLLTANTNRYKTEMEAMSMTRAMAYALVGTRMEQQAALEADPMAKARLLQYGGQLKERAGPIIQQMELRKLYERSQMGGGANSGGGQQMSRNPALGIRALIPADKQAEAFKELENVQQVMKAKDAALDVFDKLEKINSASNRLMNPIQAVKQKNALIKMAAIELVRDASGRVNIQELPAAEALFNAPFDDQETIQLKKDRLVDMQQKKLNTPILNAYGINYGNVMPQNKFDDKGKKSIKLGPPKF